VSSKTVYVNVSLTKTWLLKVSVTGDEMTDTHVSDAAFSAAEAYIQDEVNGGALDDLDDYTKSLAPRPGRGTNTLDASLTTNVDDPFAYDFNEDDPSGRA
jgi:hypothetical protein